MTGWMNWAHREARTGWAFASPGLILLAVVMGFPLVYACVLSVSSYTQIGRAHV